MNTLKAEKRDMGVKAKKLRREGFVTGNVFGREIEGSIPVKMDAMEVDRLLKTCMKGSQIMLEVDGTPMDVLVKEIDYDSLKHQVLEMDFQALVSGEKVHSVAEVILLNHEKVQIGIVQQMLHEIPYRALPSALVDRVEINVEDMKVGDAVRIKDLPIASNPDLDLHADPEAVVVMITEARRKAEDAETEEETAEESK